MRYILVCVLFLGNAVAAHAGTTAKDEEWLKVERLKRALRERAEIFNKAFIDQDFEGMYALVEPSYRREVSLKEYRDYVFYFNTKNGYMKSEILEVVVMRNRKYGKVLKKRAVYEKGNNVPVKEFVYGEDWVIVDNIWYRMESKN